MKGLKLTNVVIFYQLSLLKLQVTVNSCNTTQTTSSKFIGSQYEPLNKKVVSHFFL